MVKVGGIIMLMMFFIMGAFCQYLEWRLKKREAEGLLDLQAMYVLAAWNMPCVKPCYVVKKRKKRTFKMKLG